MNPYQEMGLENINLLAMDVLDALMELDNEYLGDVDISDDVELYLNHVQDAGTLDVRRFALSLVHRQLEYTRQHLSELQPMQTLIHRNMLQLANNALRMIS